MNQELSNEDVNAYLSEVLTRNFILKDDKQYIAELLNNSAI